MAISSKQKGAGGVILLLVLLVSAAVGYGVSNAVTSSDEAIKYATTPDGRTYGNLPTTDDFSNSDIPDLIGVMGDNGHYGYITKEDFNGGPPPKSPQDALSQQENAKSVTVPVYDSDGITVIDSFTIHGPNDGPVQLETVDE